MFANASSKDDAVQPANRCHRCAGFARQHIHKQINRQLGVGRIAGFQIAHIV